MNKKAVVSTFITDIAALILFAVIVLVFVFFPKAETYSILSKDIYSKPDLVLQNYLRAPVEFDIDNDGQKEALTFSEFIILAIEAKSPELKGKPGLASYLQAQTAEYFKQMNKNWEIRIYRYGDNGEEIIELQFSAKGAVSGVKAWANADMPYEKEGKFSKLNIVLEMEYD